jgi:UDPglucose 6-dehydrogenase
MAALDGEPAGKTVALLGLSFKPETDDMRESVSIPLARTLIDGGATVRAYDPVAMDNARPLLPEDVQYCTDSYDAAQGADLLVIVTEWNQFRSLDLERIRSLLARPAVVDLRNLYQPEKMRESGFEYEAMGRAAADLPAE